MPGPASTSPIQLDDSESEILIVCEDHPFWHAFRFTKRDALEAAALHEAIYHGTDTRRRNALWGWRHAQKRAATENQPLTQGAGARV